MLNTSVACVGPIGNPFKHLDSYYSKESHGIFNLCAKTDIHVTMHLFPSLCFLPTLWFFVKNASMAHAVRFEIQLETLVSIILVRAAVYVIHGRRLIFVLLCAYFLLYVSCLHLGSKCKMHTALSWIRFEIHLDTWVCIILTRVADSYSS